MEWSGGHSTIWEIEDALHPAGEDEEIKSFARGKRVYGERNGTNKMESQYLQKGPMLLS